MPPAVRSQNLSIMLTDIQGYSNTAATATREEIIDLIRRHNQLMRPVIEFYGGTVIKSIGDAFLCTFPSATDAVICAIIIQLLLKEYNQRLEDESKHLNLRVVINSGDVSIEENDIFGNAVNITARMEGLECFPGGTIGISESTWLLMDRTEIVAEKIGPQVLKGVPEPINVFSVPLEKQKLNKLPMQLLKLVEKVINPGAMDRMAASKQFDEWKENIGSFLKQTNWGDNINKATEHIGNIQQKLVSTFNQKSVLEKKELKDASVAKRFKSFCIDSVILLLIVFLMGIAWWPTERIFFGPAYVVVNSESSVGALYNWEYGRIDGKDVMIRRRGIFEKFVSASIFFPVIQAWIYLVLFWKFKKATPGQIAAGTAITMADGNSDIGFGLLAKRGALFLVSCIALFGVLMIFGSEKKTLYDKLCETRVVE